MSELTRPISSDLRPDQALRDDRGQPGGREGSGQHPLPAQAADPGPQHLQPQGEGESDGHGGSDQGQQGGRGADTHQVLSPHQTEDLTSHYLDLIFLFIHFTRGCENILSQIGSGLRSDWAEFDINFGISYLLYQYISICYIYFNMKIIQMRSLATINHSAEIHLMGLIWVYFLVKGISPGSVSTPASHHYQRVLIVFPLKKFRRLLAEVGDGQAAVEAGYLSCASN